jgi:alkylation response protein AidB-like acyl-CoA dehydrogenase
MDFSFSEEQTMLVDSVHRFIQNDYGFDARQKIIGTEEGYSPGNWKSFAELGWLALPFPEEVGGFGGGPIDTMILMEEFGKGLVVEPFLSTILLAGKCLEHAGGQNELLTEIISGEKLGALAFVEPQARFNLTDVKTKAAESGGKYTLAGAKGVVLGGPTADFFIVPARTSGDQRDAAGISLFLVHKGAAGLSQRDYATVDGHRASELTFDGVEGELLGTKDDGSAILERVIDEAIIGIGAEAVGAMEVMYKTTVEYCKTREQFGQPIGKFQVLQHRMVDMFVEHEQTKSLLYMAAMRMSEGYDGTAKKAVSGLKVQVCRGGKFVGQNAIQLHGGMGMTEEMAVGHYFKRVTVLETLFGNADYHLKKYAKVA